MYVYDGESLKNAAAKISCAFRELNPHYSLKANPNIELCKIILQAGFGAEVSSEYEARSALDAGFLPSRIMYDGPAKTSREITHALVEGISHFNVESRSEAVRIAGAIKKTRTACRPSICLRINPARASSAGEIMTGKSSRFGIDEEIIEDEARFIKETGLDINGVHLYIGSQILEPGEIIQNFRKGIKLLSKLYEKGFIDRESEPILNFGPGLGIDYEKEKDPLDYSYIASECLDAASAFKDKHGLTIKTEIGRAVTARSGAYISRVVETKMSRGKMYVLVDGGIHHFMRYSLTRTAHRAVIAGKTPGRTINVVIGGATCTPYDVLTETELPHPAPGDLIALMDAGAYGWSMGMSNFLSRPSPAEVITEKDGFRIIRRAGSYESLTMRAPEV